MRRYLPILVMAIVAAALTGPAVAQDKPRYGGELIFAVPSEPPSYDGHREETFGVIHPMAPAGAPARDVDERHGTVRHLAAVAVLPTFDVVQVLFARQQRPVADVALQVGPAHT